MIRQRLIRTLLLGSLLLASLGVFSQSAVYAADSAWRAAYFNNKNLSGTAVLQQDEANINYDWGDNAPNPVVNKDNFSVRWTRTINVPTAGTYRFSATMDDGMRVFVDGNVLIDSWYDSQVHSLNADVYLTAGDHALKVEYYDAGGKAIAKLSWLPTANPGPAPIVNWKGEYFNNATLSGTPAVTRDDTTIDFDWGVGSPDSTLISSDKFSARWTRTLTLTEGRYRFYVTVDDGARLWVNGRNLVDEWHEAGLITYSAEIDLPGGGIPVQMEYFENVGGAVARLSWVKLSGGGAWQGEYFNNKTLGGTPVVKRNDAQLNFNWKQGSPDALINSDGFSARWTRTLNLTAGTYRFTATADDGVRVWVNGQQIINGWSDQKPTTFIGDITLPSGGAQVVVEYYDSVGGAQIQVGWAQQSAAPAPQPQPVTPAPTTGVTGTVQSSRLNVRTGPGVQFNILNVLVQGQTVNLTGFRSADANWVQINWNNGTAWVSGKSFYLTTSTPVANLPVYQGSVPTPGEFAGDKKATVTGVYYLNMRKGPGTDFGVIKAVPGGTIVEMTGRNVNSGWVKVRLLDGSTGWMSAAYLKSSTSVASLPFTN